MTGTVEGVSAVRSVPASDGVRLAVEVAGPEDAGAAVVLAHGWTLTRSSWRPVVERLRRARPDVLAVTYDHRDHGDSGRTPFRGPRETPAMARLGDDLADVVRSVPQDVPVVLGGHSMGGMAVLAMAGRHPTLVAERVRGVVLVNTAAAELARHRGLALVMRALAAAPPAVRVPRVPAPLARRLGYGVDAPRDLVAQVRDGVKPPTARSVGAWFGALMDLDESESLERLREVPVTVLAGDSDRLTPSTHAGEIAAALPSSRLEVVPGTGHMLLFEHPDRVVEHLLHHLRQQ